MAFDLDAELDSLIAGGEIDPHALARKILGGIEDDIGALRDVAEHTLVQYVYRHLGHRRTHAARSHGSDSSRASGRSVVGEMIREGSWRRELREVYPVGDGHWKRLADMGISDLDYAAELREKQAAGIAANAVRLRDLAAALKNSAADKVSDLSDDTLAGVFARAA